MAGIYVHIPFCRKACHYCNFHFTTSFNKKDELIGAILEEIRLQSGYLQGQKIKTIYFGGGTPSALPPADIEKILLRIKEMHQILPNAEITLEANPDDIKPENLEQWKQSGVNRLSIGLQAFQDELLIGWNRTHSAEQARSCIPLAQSAGFENITADLIYGGPGLSDEDWESNIQTLIDFGIPHISCYALTVESGTVLAHQIKKGLSKTPEDEQSARQYEILQTKLRNAGYEQYEVSNFAKPGFESRHNKSYWSGDHYLGLGPAAHSYDGKSRQWNVANNVKYTNAIRHGSLPMEQEILTETQCFNEIVMTGLRTSAGIDISRIRKLGERFENYLENIVQPYIDSGKIIKQPSGNYALVPEYYFFADGIAAEMFWEERENVRT